MKTDRELLELAARAAGAKWTDYSDGTADHWIIRHSDGIWRKWNPLEDDGDALRLAVKLGLAVCIDILDDATSIRPYADGDDLLAHAHFDGGPDAATRRAIVRAAANIGSQS